MTQTRRPYTIIGTDPNLSREIKLTRAERARLEENQERRTARCRFCGDPRDPRSGPFCEKCTGAKIHGGSSS